MNLLQGLKGKGQNTTACEVTEEDLAQVKASPARKFTSSRTKNDYFSTTMYWKELNEQTNAVEEKSMRLLCQAEGQTLQPGMHVEIREYETGKWSAAIA